MKKFHLLLLLLPFAVVGCGSLGDAMFLAQKLDDQDKATALTAAGIDEYQLHLVRRKDFDEIPRIKEYFTGALRFDPTNVQAQQYVALIDNYKATQLKTNLANANRALAKPKRTDDDNYALFVTLQTAARIDATDKTLQKMLGDTAQDRSKLVDSYVSKSKASIAGLDAKATAAAREKAYGDAFQNAKKAIDIDPKSGAAQAQMNAVMSELKKIVAARVDAIQKLIAAAKYPDARTQASALSDLNRKVGNSFDPDVKSTTYTLNYTWAQALFKQKDYVNADARTDAALAVSRTAEATALKKQIASVKTKADTGVSFENSLADIDKLIASGDLLAAHSKLDAVASVTTDQAKLSQLDDRDQKIIDALKPLYDQGVQAYRDEDFKTAIDALQTVVNIKVDYEQAGDYLDKAKSKQKLLDQL